MRAMLTLNLSFLVQSIAIARPTIAHTALQQIAALGGLPQGPTLGFPPETSGGADASPVRPRYRKTPKPRRTPPRSHRRYALAPATTPSTRHPRSPTQPEVPQKPPRMRKHQRNPAAPI